MIRIIRGPFSCMGHFRRRRRCAAPGLRDGNRKRRAHDFGHDSGPPRSLLATTTRSSASSSSPRSSGGWSACWSGWSSRSSSPMPALNFAPWLTLRPAAPAAHERGDLRLRRQRVLRRRLLLDAAAAQGADVLRPAEPASTSGAGRLIIVAAAITLPLGFTQAKEYAELEWPIDIAIAVVWVVVRGQLLRHDRAAARAAPLRRALVLHRHHHHGRDPPHLQQPRRSRPARSRATRSTPACRTRSCSGGTGTTRSRSS